MRPSVPPLRPPAAQDLDAMPVPILACPDCGSAAVHPLRLDEGGIPGTAETSDKVACPRCGYQGLPVEFRSAEDYRAFLETEA